MRQQPGICKRYTTAVLLTLFFFITTLHAQKVNEDSLRKVIKAAISDTARIDALLALANYEIKHKMQDSAGLVTLQQARTLSQQVNYPYGLMQCLLTTGNYYRSRNDWSKSIEAYNGIIRLSTGIQDDSLQQRALMMAYNNLGGIYNFNGDFKSSLGYRLRSMEIVDRLMPENYTNRAIVYLNIASDYRQL